MVQGGGVTSPAGFLAAGNHVGVKRKHKDLALLLSETPAVAAAMFTQNKVRAAPVVWSHRIVESNRSVRAVVVNSGNANACTGSVGLADAQKMAEAVASSLNISSREVLVASTGVIGVPLPIETICTGIAAISNELDSTLDAGLGAAEAIMTTDTFVKQTAVTLSVGGEVVTIGGMAKGSGMIHPNMATMLGFITTDAKISQSALQGALREAVADSFNMISVDGDTSTNDSVMVLANGMAGNDEITGSGLDYELFCAALKQVCVTLATQIARDGEGATKLLEVQISGAKTDADARKLSKAIVSSSLVKTAFFGEDANWGRIIAAMGYADADFDPSRVRIEFVSHGGSVLLMEGGEPIAFDEGDASRVLQEHDITILVSLSDGTAKSIAWGCDLSYDYVRINGDYRT